MKKTIVIDGKTEVRLYETPVGYAELILNRGNALDKTCCGAHQGRTSLTGHTTTPPEI